MALAWRLRLESLSCKDRSCGDVAPLFNFFTHLYGIFYWSKHTDPNGDMVPKSANKWIWLITIGFMAIGLALFPTVNALLASYGYAVVDNDSSKLGFISFFWINVIAFIVSITAQVAMILRYSFSWWLWIVSNFVWLTVNLITGNYIFAIQTMIYQVNSSLALYGIEARLSCCYRFKKTSKALF
jgi:nicotinamide mononucleotide transporter